MDTDTLALLKKHCHIDHDDDDAQLTMLYGTAVEYLADAGISMADTDKYRLAAFSLVLEWYDAGQTGTVTVGLRQLINQLKLSSVAQLGDGL